MGLVWAKSGSAVAAFSIVQDLQAYLVAKLTALNSTQSDLTFESIDWQRNQGLFGGGNRFVARDTDLFNRASVNISQVQYENDPSKKLASATALSTIIHPKNPFAPSMHMHISWTEMKNDKVQRHGEGESESESVGYWRIMADLNPSLPSETDKALFIEAIRKVTGPLFEIGRAQGDRYFHIPALDRHRGVVHFYLEEHHGSSAEADRVLARRFGEAISDVYTDIVREALEKAPAWDSKHRSDQLAYHSLYFLQVLTLDRGTTSGLLVHDENDTGILGSLPSEVDKDLLESWLPRLPTLQADLLKRILRELSGQKISPVDDEAKQRIAKVTRVFYKEHPEALELLARGDRVPPTQDNHRSV